MSFYMIATIFECKYGERRPRQSECLKTLEAAQVGRADTVRLRHNDGDSMRGRESEETELSRGDAAAE